MLTKERTYRGCKKTKEASVGRKVKGETLKVDRTLKPNFA